MNFYDDPTDTTWIEQARDEAMLGCGGPYGCEWHDGECKDDWKHFDSP